MKWNPNEWTKQILVNNRDKEEDFSTFSAIWVYGYMTNWIPIEVFSNKEINIY